MTVVSSTRELVAKNPCSYSPTYKVGLKKYIVYLIILLINVYHKKKKLEEILNTGYEWSIMGNSFHCSYKKTCCFPCSRNLFLQCSEDSCPVRWSKVSGAKLVKGTFCRPSWSMVYMATTGERKSVYHSTSPVMVWKIHTVLTYLF